MASGNKSKSKLDAGPAGLRIRQRLNFISVLFEPSAGNGLQWLPRSCACAIPASLSLSNAALEIETTRLSLEPLGKSILTCVLERDLDTQRIYAASNGSTVRAGIL